MFGSLINFMGNTVQRWLTIAALLSAAAGAAVGIVLSGQVLGTVSTAVSQAILIDASQFDEKDISSHAARRFVSVSDDQTSFTAAAEISTGDEVAIDVPLINLSTDVASVELTLEWPSQVQVNAEPFWTSETFTRSLAAGTISRTFTTPSPAPLTVTDEQSKNASVETNIQPTGSAAISARFANSSKTNTQPTGAAAVSAKAANSVKTNTSPTGSAGIGPPHTMVADPAPAPTGAPFSPTGTYRTGFFVVALDSDGVVDDLIHFVLTDTDGNFTPDTLDLSLNSTFGEGGLLNNGNVDAGDDERTTVTPSDIVFGTVDYTFTVVFIDFTPGPWVVTLTSKTWYTGAFTLALDSDGTVNDTLNFALVDTNSDGTFETLELSQADTTYGQGGFLTNSNVDTGEDERITVTTDIVYGSVNYTLTTAFDINPEADASDARLTSKTWYTGTLTADLNADADLLDLADIIAFALSDTDSDGRYDTLDLSTDDGLLPFTTFGETAGGPLSGQTPRRTGTDDDERLSIFPSPDTGGGNTGGSADVRLGAFYLFTVAFDHNPELDLSDARITSKTWYTSDGFSGTPFVIDATGDGTADNPVAWAISDTNSDGLYDKIDLSMDDTIFGDGAQGNGRVGLTEDDDEQASLSSEVFFGNSINANAPKFKITRLDPSPVGDADPFVDVGITSPWYVGTFAIDINGDQKPDTLDFVLVDPGTSEGLYTKLNLDRDDSGGYIASEEHTSDELVLLGGMKIQVTFPSTALSLTFTQGKITNVVRAGPNRWLITVPATAKEGGTQDNVRLKVATLDTSPPGFYQVKGKFRQIDGR